MEPANGGFNETACRAFCDVHYLNSCFGAFRFDSVLTRSLALPRRFIRFSTRLGLFVKMTEGSYCLDKKLSHFSAPRRPAPREWDLVDITAFQDNALLLYDAIKRLRVLRPRNYRDVATYKSYVS